MEEIDDVESDRTRPRNQSKDGGPDSKLMRHGRRRILAGMLFANCGRHVCSPGQGIGRQDIPNSASSVCRRVDALLMPRNRYQFPWNRSQARVIHPRLCSVRQLGIGRINVLLIIKKRREKDRRIFYIEDIFRMVWNFCFLIDEKVYDWCGGWKEDGGWSMMDEFLLRWLEKIDRYIVRELSMIIQGWRDGIFALLTEKIDRRRNGWVRRDDR